MKNCPFCDYRIDDEATYCHFCGKRLPSNEFQNETKDIDLQFKKTALKKISLSWWKILLLVLHTLLVIVSIGFFIFLSLLSMYLTEKIIFLIMIFTIPIFFIVTVIFQWQFFLQRNKRLFQLFHLLCWLSPILSTTMYLIIGFGKVTIGT